MTPRLSGPFLIALFLGVPSGCTAVKASVQAVSAEESLRRAREHGADEIAVYEYTMALRYLEKAREEIGYSQFRVADALARQSAEWSDRAIIFVEKHGRTQIEWTDSEEGTPPAPAPAPVAPIELDE